MAIAKINTTDFSSAITPIHRKYFTQAYYAEVAKEYEEIVKVETMGKPTETKQHFGGFGMPDSNTEGQTINVDTMSEGDSASLTSTRYDKGYYITHEMVAHDLSGVFGGAGMMGKTKVNDAPQQMGRGFGAREEYQAARIFTEGFGNTGYDGVATFYDSHPLADSASTGDNLVTGALTPANLKSGITLMRTGTVDEANILAVVRPQFLAVPPQLEFTAAEVLGSSNQAFEMSNTSNSIGGLKIKVMDWFAKSGSTYASTNWFLISKDVENAIFGWLERPWFDTQFVPQSPDLFAYGYMHFATGVVNWRGLVGSTGA